MLGTSICTKDWQHLRFCEVDCCLLSEEFPPGLLSVKESHAIIVGEKKANTFTLPGLNPSAPPQGLDSIFPSAAATTAPLSTQPPPSPPDPPSTHPLSLLNPLIPPHQTLPLPSFPLPGWPWFCVTEKLELSRGIQFNFLPSEWQIPGSRFLLSSLYQVSDWNIALSCFESLTLPLSSVIGHLAPAHPSICIKDFIRVLYSVFAVFPNIHFLALPPLSADSRPILKIGYFSYAKQTQNNTPKASVYWCPLDLGHLCPTVFHAKSLLNTHLLCSVVVRVAHSSMKSSWANVINNLVSLGSNV